MISAVRLHMLVYSVVAHLRGPPDDSDPVVSAADFLDSAATGIRAKESIPVALPVVTATAGLEVVSDAAAAVAQDGKTSVSCGGHTMPTCAECPLGHGAAWCGGDCHWSKKVDACVSRAVLRKQEHEIFMEDYGQYSLDTISARAWRALLSLSSRSDMYSGLN